METDLFDTSLTGYRYASWARYPRARFKPRDASCRRWQVQNEDCSVNRKEGRQGLQAGIIESPATLQITQHPRLGLYCRVLMVGFVPMTHDNYSGVLSHYRPLDATRPIVPCILILRRRMGEALFLNWSDQGQS